MQAIATIFSPLCSIPFRCCSSCRVNAHCTRYAPKVHVRTFVHSFYTYMCDKMKHSEAFERYEAKPNFTLFAEKVYKVTALVICIVDINGVKRRPIEQMTTRTAMAQRKQSKAQSGESIDRLEQVTNSNITWLKGRQANWMINESIVRSTLSSIWDNIIHFLTRHYLRIMCSSLLIVRRLVMLSSAPRTERRGTSSTSRGAWASANSLYRTCTLNISIWIRTRPGIQSWTEIVKRATAHSRYTRLHRTRKSKEQTNDEENENGQRKWNIFYCWNYKIAMWFWSIV